MKCNSYPSVVREYMEYKRNHAVQWFAFFTRDAHMIMVKLDNLENALIACPFMLENQNGIHLRKLSYNTPNLEARKFFNQLKNFRLYTIPAELCKERKSNDMTPAWKDCEKVVRNLFDGVLTCNLHNHAADVTFRDAEGNVQRVEVKGLRGWMDGTHIEDDEA